MRDKKKLPGKVSCTDASGRRLPAQLTQEAKLPLISSLIRAILAFAGFVCALRLNLAIPQGLANAPQKAKMLPLGFLGMQFLRLRLCSRSDAAVAAFSFARGDGVQIQDLRPDA